MKELISVIVIAALLIGATALAVEKFHDRETFVSPPDAIAEGFVRSVLEKRWDPARAYLSEPESTSDQQLSDLQKSWEARLGELSEIEAETISRDDERAQVNVTLRSARGEEEVAFALTFDDDWKVVHTPAVGNPIH